MDIKKIKNWLTSKPLWVKILVSVLCVVILGLSAWFGISSCASVNVDKFNVNTDKVQVDVEGVQVEPKLVSALLDNFDYSFLEV